MINPELHKAFCEYINDQIFQLEHEIDETEYDIEKNSKSIDSHKDLINNLIEKNEALELKKAKESYTLEKYKEFYKSLIIEKE